MLRTKYEREVSNYFLDNGDLVFDLHVAIEGLVFTGGVPVTGDHYVSSDGVHVWGILNHVVVYNIEGNILNVFAVMPAN